MTPAVVMIQSELLAGAIAAEVRSSLPFTSSELLAALAPGRTAAGNYETTVLQMLERMITQLGGVVPAQSIPSNYRERHLELLNTLVSLLG